MKEFFETRVFKVSLLFGCSIVIFLFTTAYMTLASISYFFFIAGIFLCKSRKTHSYFMYAGITIDILLLLTLEFTRSAIAEAISSQMNTLQRGHIICSSIAVLLYIPSVYLGNKALKAKQKNLHKQIGMTAFAFRSIGFLLMFSLLNKVQN